MDWELLLGIGRFVLATTLLLLLTVPTAFVIIQMELKVIAGMNLRLGPNRIGPSGMFQSTIHGFKVLAKEDTVPDQADRGTFTLAPWMVYMAAAMSMLVIPFAPGAVASNMNIGIVYFFAVLGLSVVGLLVAGWASYNKYSLLGGLRSAAQMVSYEIPLTLSIVGAVVLAGTLNFSELIAWQRENGWLFVCAAGRRRHLLRRLAGRGEPHAVRHGRGRLGAGGRAVHRVLGHALRLLLLCRVRGAVHHERHPDQPLLRRLAGPVAVPRPAGRLRWHALRRSSGSS